MHTDGVNVIIEQYRDGSGSRLTVVECRMFESSTEPFTKYHEEYLSHDTNSENITIRH